jgi:hypothetical protein
MTMSLIQTVVLGSASSSIVLSGIPATGDDLYVVYSLRTNDNFDYARITFNSSQGGSGRELSWTGSGMSFSGQSFVIGGVYTGPSTVANTFSNASFYLSNYKLTINKKLFTMSGAETNAATPSRIMLAGSGLSSTDPITSITISTSPTANFVANSSVSLYTVTQGVGGATIS